MVASNVSTTPTDNGDYVPPSEEYLKERDVCVKYFDQWNELEQVYFVQHLISHMCHYQHGQVNVFLMPMLQRDFISALPGMSAVHFLIQYSTYGFAHSISQFCDVSTKRQQRVHVPLLIQMLKFTPSLSQIPWYRPTHLLTQVHVTN